MKTGAEDKRKLWAAGVLGVLALGAVVYLYEMLFAGPDTVAPTPVVVTTTAPVNTPVATGKVVVSPAGIGVGGAAQRVGTTTATLDPTLHMEAMRVTESLVYTGSGRNIFASGPGPLPVAKVVQAKFSARPKPVTMPVAVVNLGPPPPPPINLKFFGTATSAAGLKRAFLLNGDDVYLAAVGDVVQRRYRVVAISANSILVEDLPNSNRQSLPLTGN